MASRDHRIPAAPFVCVGSRDDAMHMCRLIQARAIHVLVHWRRRLPRHWARHNWHSQ